MKRYAVHPKDPFAGIFTDLYILGVGRAAASASDFTDPDTSQTITLATPDIGDIVEGAAAWTKIAFAGGALSAVALDVGFAGGSEFISAGAMFLATAAAKRATSLVAKVFDGATLLTAKVDTTGANLNAITAGELWIYVRLLRRNDYRTLIYG